MGEMFSPRQRSLTRTASIAGWLSGTSGLEDRSFRTSVPAELVSSRRALALGLAEGCSWAEMMFERPKAIIAVNIRFRCIQRTPFTEPLTNLLELRKSQAD